MEFNIEKKKKKNSDKFEKNDIDLAYNFAKRAYKEFGAFLKGIVIFGSAAKKKRKSNDVDVLVIVDDLTMTLSKELVQTYRIIIEKIVLDVSPRLHITTLKFTNFWEYVRNGDPVAVNILRDGYALIDNGFFEPLQALLYQGRIRPSPEAVWAYFSKTKMTIQNSKWHIMQAVVDLYWAVIDSAHAALMKINVVPPSPEHVADMMQERLVKPGLIDKEYPKTMSRFYDMMKMITGRDIKEIKGSDYQEYQKEAVKFVNAMEEFLKK